MTKNRPAAGKLVFHIQNTAFIAVLPIVKREKMAFRHFSSFAIQLLVDFFLIKLKFRIGFPDPYLKSAM
jgi:hypothetical protein